jgi:DNA-binding response OmpR family regulator
MAHRMDISRLVDIPSSFETVRTSLTAARLRFRRLISSADGEFECTIASPRDEKGAISFGPFRLLPTERLLEKEGIPVHVGGRALDILIFLVERAGEVVSKKGRVRSPVHVGVAPWCASL